MFEQLSFVTFRKFNDKALAIELGEFLSQHKIDYLLEDASPRLDSSFGGSELLQEYAIKLNKADFEKADDLLTEVSVNNIDAIDKDYYLFGFSNDELMEIVVKKDEWGNFDYLLAQKLLKDRGNEIQPEKLEKLRNERLETLAKPEKSQTAAIIAGYVFALLGGVFGIFIGWYLKSHKKTLPNGESVYNYSESDRRQGRRIFFLGIACLILGIFVRTILKMFQD